MDRRGQMALDLVIAFILVLVVFLGFVEVVTNFQESQLEIGLRQQLQQNASVISEMTIHAFQYYHVNFKYPNSHSTVIPVTNQFTRMTGKIHTSPIQGIELGNSLNCKIKINYVPGPGSSYLGIITLSIPSTQTGLPRDVNGYKQIVAIPGVETKYTLSLQNCGYDFVIG